MDTLSQITASKTLSNLYKFAHKISHTSADDSRNYILNILTLYKIILLQFHYMEDSNKQQNTCKTHSTQDICSHQAVKGTWKLMPSEAKIT